MTKSTQLPVARNTHGASQQALRVFGISCGCLLAAVLVFLLCAICFGRENVINQFVFPKAFLVSTFLLAIGSYSIQQAKGFVRLEKQFQFRRWLVVTLVTGTLFTGIQTYGLWAMFPPERSTDDAVRGVTGFVIALSTLHAIHFCVAELFLVYIAVRTWADRYDHEYYWGVTVCTWFWHFLGIVWVAILAVISIVL